MRDPFGERKPRSMEEAELAARLLAEGGKKVVFPPDGDPDLPAILERGEVWDGEEAWLDEMEPSRCHQNAARFYLSEPERYRIVTGYGLGPDDGIWRSHSWVIDVWNDSLKETTMVRDLYFGAVMTPAEAEKFAFWNA